MSSSLKRDPEESLADRRKRLRAHAEARFQSTRATWADLPPDAVRLVVKRAADLADSSVPVVPVVASVCRAWRDAVLRHPSELWRRADFSGDFDPSDAVIARYCRDGHWRELQHLDLRDCPRVSDRALHALVEGAPALASLRVSDVGARAPRGNRNARRAPRGVSVDALVRALEHAAFSRLGAIEIDRLGECPANDRERLCRALFANERRVAAAARDAPRALANVAAFLPPSGLPSLTKLDLTNAAASTGGATLPWVELAVRCPAMRELRLNGLGGAQGWEPRPRVGAARDPFRRRGGPSASDPREGAPGFPGFPRLEVLELGAARVTTSAGYDVGASGVGCDLLFRLVHASRNLRELDVTGARDALGPECLDRFRPGARGARAGGVGSDLDALGFTAEHLVGTLFCARGECPLRVLRCSKTGWAGGRGGEAGAAAFRAFFFADTNTPRFPRLRVLELGSRGAHAPRVGDEALYVVAAALGGTLERLAIAGSTVTDAGVSCALARARRLAALDASHCRGLSREARRAASKGDLRGLAGLADPARVAALDADVSDLLTRSAAASDGGENGA